MNYIVIHANEKAKGDKGGGDKGTQYLIIEAVSSHGRIVKRTALEASPLIAQSGDRRRTLGSDLFIEQTEEALERKRMQGRPGQRRAEE